MRSLAEGDAVEEIDVGAFVAWVVPARVPLRPLWARRGGRVAVGNVRLDHPEEVRRWGGTREPRPSSLEIVLGAYETRGQCCLREMLGDFCLVIYDEATQVLVAARDAVGVKALYVGKRRGDLILSSHLEAVHDVETIDEEFLADFLIGGDPGPERTIWADSQAVPQGSLLITQNGKVANSRFWTPHAFSIANEVKEGERVEQFRALFAEAVRIRLGTESETWAELSGGLDSSSVVCMAHHLRISRNVATGIAGTITLADELGDGDERTYSQLVAAQCDLRNEVVLNPWPWRDDGQAPPLTDEPRAHYPYFSRDRAICDLARNAGGKVLLGGWGADHYLYCSKLFMADVLARGAPVSMLRLARQWSVAERKSFWGTVAREALAPLLPGLGRQCFAPAWDRIPAWIQPGFARRTGLAARLASARAARAPRGHQFEREVANNLQELTRWLPRGSYELGLEPRYPFLYRPLIELGLQLPPFLRARPLAQKWILREAMVGLLPEMVRLRTGKGGIDARLLWAFSQERERLDEIMGAPMLAEVGAVSAASLARAVEDARHGRAPATVMMLCVLGLETWLFVRSGRWTVSGRNYSNRRVSAPRGRHLAASKGGDIR
ncbi:MAG: hypothetical protein H0T86_09435 [Gemmatimonadales bacterium]|nr:hypothetical protein [Gemmatimonadales bacterium]